MIIFSKLLQHTIKPKLSRLLLVSLLIIGVLYYMTYWVPFTNNAFVVANIRPVAANVKGYITHIYVKNEEYVKKGRPLLTVFQKPYQLSYKKSVADVEKAKAELAVSYKKIEKTQYLLTAERQTYEKLAFDYERYRKALRASAVPEVTVNNMLKEKNAAFSRVQSLKAALELAEKNIQVEKMNISSLEAVMDNAKVELDETIVYAKNNGVIQNMYSAVGSPVEIRKPLFSFIDTDNMFIQANFNETDLHHVRAGDKVTIIPRIYFWQKVYHGVVVSQNWAASRQRTDARSQEQIVLNSESNWFLLPQRLPVQIRLLDYDPIHYPLSIGSSAYVYIH